MADSMLEIMQARGGTVGAIAYANPYHCEVCYRRMLATGVHAARRACDGRVLPCGCGLDHSGYPDPA